MNIILFSRNFEKYISGYYHQDIVEAIQLNSNSYIYGPGYDKYCSTDNFQNVVDKSIFNSLDDIDLIIFSTSWDNDESELTVDPHPAIDFSNINIPKLYYLNKEYKKLDVRFKYIKNQKIDFVATVNSSYKVWERDLKVRFLKYNFGINTKRIGATSNKKKYDFGFTGALHNNHIDSRTIIKKSIFKKKFHNTKSNINQFRYQKKSMLNNDFQNYSIYWAEWGSKDLFGKSLLPKGDKYFNFLSQCKVFLNSLSASNIINTRFFELMYLKTLIICPQDNYEGILKNNYNCIMFSSQNDFKIKLYDIINNKSNYQNIVSNAKKTVSNYEYQSMLKKLLLEI